MLVKPIKGNDYANVCINNSVGPACADPEVFIRGGPTSTMIFILVDEGRKNPDTTISGSSKARQQNAI